MSEYDSLKEYFNEVKKYPLLTTKEEEELGKRIIAGDRKAVNKLVNSHLRAVIKIARKYTGRGLRLSDLIQEGNIGLMRAAEKFDYRKGVRFCSYSPWWIRQKIIRAIDEQPRNIRLPVNKSNLVGRMKRAEAELSSQNHHEPSLKEISDYIKVSYETLSQVRLMDDVSSLDSISEGKSDFGALIDERENPEEKSVYDSFITEIRNIVNRVLDERERGILESCFGLDGHGPKTLKEIGFIYGITRERVRQIKGEALRKLKDSPFESRLRQYIHNEPANSRPC